MLVDIKTPITSVLIRIYLKIISQTKKISVYIYNNIAVFYIRIKNGEGSKIKAEENDETMNHSKKKQICTYTIHYQMKLTFSKTIAIL